MKASKGHLSFTFSDQETEFVYASEELFFIIPDELWTNLETREWYSPPVGHFYFKKPMSFNDLFENIYYKAQFIIKNRRTVDFESNVKLVGDILFEAKMLGGAETIIDHIKKAKNRTKNIINEFCNYFGKSPDFFIFLFNGDWGEMKPHINNFKKSVLKLKMGHCIFLAIFVYQKKMFQARIRKYCHNMMEKLREYLLEMVGTKLMAKKEEKKVQKADNLTKVNEKKVQKEDKMLKLLEISKTPSNAPELDINILQEIKIIEEEIAKFEDEIKKIDSEILELNTQKEELSQKTEEQLLALVDPLQFEKFMDSTTVETWERMIALQKKLRNN